MARLLLVCIMRYCLKEKDRSCNAFYGFTSGLFFLKEYAAAPSLSIIPAAL